MNHMVTQFLLFFFLALPIFSADTNKNKTPLEILERACEVGASYAEEDEYPYAIHAQKSQEQIKNLLQGSTGVVLVLGPGPGRDLPLNDLVLQFDHVILIDGYIAPMVTWKASLDPALKNKVHIIQADLSGGFAKFLSEQSSQIVRALSEDFANFFRDQKLAIKSYQQLFEQQPFIVNLAQYHPNVVVSSLVTSQTEEIFDTPIEELVDKAISQSGIFLPDVPTTAALRQHFLKEVRKLNQAKIQHAYVTGIVRCQAQKIYYADTNHVEDPSNDDPESVTYDEVVDSRMLDGFVQAMIEAYTVEKEDFAWDYREVANEEEQEFRYPEMPVSWIKFTKKSS
jgi:hypothetical protein